MPETITVSVNGEAVTVSAGTTVAAAIIQSKSWCRRSARGELRGPLCGMGTCFECRAVINGRPHCRSCQVVCEPGMRVSIDV